VVGVVVAVGVGVAVVGVVVAVVGVVVAVVGVGVAVVGVGVAGPVGVVVVGVVVVPVGVAVVVTPEGAPLADRAPRAAVPPSIQPFRALDTARVLARSDSRERQPALVLRRGSLRSTEVTLEPSPER
jgi:hypothetical protein